MYRLTVIFMNILTFLIAQLFSLSAFALQASEFKAYNDFFAESGVTKKAVPLKEIFQKFGSTLPADVRVQMENYLKENPNTIIPKVDVQKIGSELQITYHQGSDHLVVRTKSNSGPNWGTVVGTRNGEEIKEDVSLFTFIAGAQYVYQQRAAEEMKRPKFLSAADFEKLDPSQRAQYLKHVRKILENVETLQNSSATTKKEVSMFDLLIESAWALEGSCIIAGYVGDYYSSDKCKLPRSAGYTQGGCAKGSTQCNPLLYGPNSCVDNKKIRDATKSCNGLNEPTDAILIHMNKIKDEATFNQLMTGVKAQTLQYVQQCQKKIIPDFEAKKIGQDQKETCENLIKRIEQINSLTCQDYKNRLGKESSFKCQPEPAPAPIASAPAAAPAKPSEKPQTGLPVCTPAAGAGADGSTTSGAGSTTTGSGSGPQVCLPISGAATNTGNAGADTTPPEAKPEGKPEAKPDSKPETKPEIKPETKVDEQKQKSDCELLSKFQGDLKCDGQVSKEVLTCKLSVDGKTVARTLNYCDCRNPKQKVVPNGFSSDKFATECAKSSSESSKTRDAKNQKTESSEFMKNAVKVLPFALGGLMLWAVHSAQKQQMQNYYDMYLKQINSIQPPVPPPTTYTTPITLTPPAAGGAR